MTYVERRLATWRRRLERRRRLRDLELTIPGAARPYRIAAPADPDAVLDELAAALDGGAPGPDGPGAGGQEPHMPYWATPWASGLALAEAALERRGEVAGRRALELGCGLGTTATAVLEAGGRLVAADCFSESLAYCRYNALRNSGRVPQLLLADWRTAAGRQALLEAGPVDLLLAADVLYEPEDVAPLLDLVPRLLRPGAPFWLAEPGRATSARFVAAARAGGWPEQTVHLERDWPGGAGYAGVTIHFYIPVSTLVPPAALIAHDGGAAPAR